MVKLLSIVSVLFIAFIILWVNDRRNTWALREAVKRKLTSQSQNARVTQEGHVLPVETNNAIEDEAIYMPQDSDEIEIPPDEINAFSDETVIENSDRENSVADNALGDIMLPNHNTPFTLHFDNGQVATAVRVALATSAQVIMDFLHLNKGPALFITGGAGAMTAEDIQRTGEIIQAIADFAEENHVTVIDGGTESGIMQMIGDARRSRDYTFTLVGVAPLGRVSYPGYTNPNEEAFLEDSHTHFVLVDGDEWGTESELLVSMANAISEKRTHGVIGVLINGGKITRQDVYLAVSKELPILVLEGSGRFADEVATAFKTGKANQSILRAILAGGDIQLVSTIDGPTAMRTKLEERFNTNTT